MQTRNRSRVRYKGSNDRSRPSFLARKSSVSSSSGGGRGNVASKDTKIQSAVSRSQSLKILIALIGLILGSRLFYLQVVRHSHYDSLAQAEHQKKFSLPASRGTLYFRDGDDVVPAVLNTTVYTLYADPKEVKNVDESANYISAILNFDKDQLKQKMKTKNTAYVVLEKRLAKDQVDQLFKQKNKLRGINVTPVPQRVYPEGLLGGQLLGFVNNDGIGQYGIEGALNKRLSGQAGTLKAVTDVRGVPLSLEDSNNIEKPPKNGENLILTIDRNIQAKTEEALANGLQKTGATKASAIVIDPRTGAIRAMANLPTYDPAKYYEVGDDAYEKFRNRVISDPYEAGSVIKTLTMTAGLNEGKVGPESTFRNTGRVQVDDTVIKNAEQDVNGTRTMTDVLKYSLNTGVVYVLSQLGGGNVNGAAREKLYDYFANKYGFGSLTGVEQAGETEGSIYGPKTGEGNNVRYANMSFGQGMNVTMVQTAAAFSAVVNGGNYYKPHLVEGVQTDVGELKNKPPQPTRPTIISSNASAQIREMTRVAMAESAAVNKLSTPGYRVGGKTGTSQIIDSRTGKYIDTNAIGTYLGYGGGEMPEYVIMVRVDDSKLSGYAGSTSAAPIFAEISNWLLQYYNVKPM